MVEPYGYDDTDDNATPMRRAGVLLVLLVLLLPFGCSGAEPLEEALDTSVRAKPRPEAVVVAAPGPDGPAESTTGVAASDAAEAGAGGSGPFGVGPRAQGGSGLDADTLLAVRHGVHEDYERIVLDLGAGEEPAGEVPRWTLASRRGDGLLRVELPSANATGVSDGRLGDGLLEGFHVVRAPDGGMFVDVLSREAFRYRVLELTRPARLVVDFEAAGTSPEKPPPAAGGNTVLLEPRPGTRVSDPLTVSGYSRNFEAANTMILEDSKGEVLARKTVAANDWSSTWGYFEATLDLPPFAGEGTLKVGTTSARDGSFEGVEIPLEGS